MLAASRSTGKERDAESGLDYFGARYYNSPAGRWTSPDWAAKEEPIPYARMDDPQSLNLYAYVGNNPLRRTDPDGHMPPPDRFGCSEGESCANNQQQWAAQFASNAAAAVAAQQNVSARDQAYLAKYYAPVATQATAIGVDPALPLGIGIESGFGTNGTYLSTGDVFWMTGGSTANMTQAASPAQDV